MRNFFRKYKIAFTTVAAIIIGTSYQYFSPTMWIIMILVVIVGIMLGAE